jgi:Ni,Fe-hydrogenase I large subunit
MTASLQADLMALESIRDRNIARVREIDATLRELQPIIQRLTVERWACIDTASRVNPPSPTNESAYAGDGCNSAPQLRTPGSTD